MAWTVPCERLTETKTEAGVFGNGEFDGLLVLSENFGAGDNALGVAVVPGTTRHVQSSSEMTGFIMVTVKTGKGTTFVVVPTIDQDDVNEVCDVDAKDEF